VVWIHYQTEEHLTGDSRQYLQVPLGSPRFIHVLKEGTKPSEQNSSRALAFNLIQLQVVYELRLKYVEKSLSK